MFSVGVVTPSPWVVVRVRPNFLARAIDNMKRQGCECYTPRAMIRSPRTHRLSAQPLFPGYVFARHLAGRWMFLRGTFGVLGVVMGASGASKDPEPARVPDHELARLRAREGPDGLVRLESREFELGEHVRVDRGAVSMDAIVDGMSGQDRVFVLLQILGGARAEVSAQDIYR